MFGHRLNSNQARICDLGFSANMVWLISNFFHFSLYFYFIFLHFNLINIQCQMDSLHNLPSGSSAGRIAYIICRPAVLDGKLCRLSVRHYCRMTSYVGYPSGSSAGRIAYITCHPAAEWIATANLIYLNFIMRSSSF